MVQCAYTIHTLYCVYTQITTENGTVCLYFVLCIQYIKTRKLVLYVTWKGTVCLFCTALCIHVINSNIRKWFCACAYTLYCVYIQLTSETGTICDLYL